MLGCELQVTFVCVCKWVGKQRVGWVLFCELLTRVCTEMSAGINLQTVVGAAGNLSIHQHFDRKGHRMWQLVGRHARSTQPSWQLTLFVAQAAPGATEETEDGVATPGPPQVGGAGRT